TPKSDEKDYYVGNIPFIRSGEIHKANTELHISEDGLANSSAKMVKKGDLLYALYGANSGECDISKISGAINQAVLCIRPIKDDVYYIFLWLSYFRKYIVSTFLQGGQGNLSATTIKRLSVMLPCIEEQRKIADFLSIFDKKITAEKQVLSDLQEIKKGLLQQMFV
ncbi:MAG: restriction endonuclease subunit S, partial [Selenomonadaceae bacterium]|nr:restriction endonuclease subunit S [Selenomonadaceae bacterium]